MSEKAIVILARKKGGKDDAKDFSLNNWWNVAAVH